MTVPDPHLEIRGGGGGLKKSFRPFRPQFGLKIRGAGREKRSLKDKMIFSLKKVLIFESFCPYFTVQEEGSVLKLRSYEKQLSLSTRPVSLCMIWSLSCAVCQSNE